MPWNNTARFRPTDFDALLQMTKVRALRNVRDGYHAHPLAQTEQMFNIFNWQYTLTMIALKKKHPYSSLEIAGASAPKLHPRG